VWRSDYGKYARFADDENFTASRRLDAGRHARRAAILHTCKRAFYLRDDAAAAALSGGRGDWLGVQPRLSSPRRRGQLQQLLQRRADDLYDALDQ